MSYPTAQASAQPVAAAPGQQLSVAIVPVLKLANGHYLGDLPAPSAFDNRIEDARLALARMGSLWAISKKDHDDTIKAWAGLTGQLLPPDLNPLIRAIRNALHPSLASEVANYYLPVDLPTGGNIGPAGTVNSDKVKEVQNALRALDGHQQVWVSGTLSPFVGLKSADVNGVFSPATQTAIQGFKKGIAGGTLGWRPIRADESNSQGDLYAGRTYSNIFRENRYRNYSVFVPKGAKPGACSVHIFFSPGGVETDSGANAMLMHGIRAAFAETKWIVIGVPGYADAKQELENKKFLNLIKESEILRILHFVWGNANNTIEDLSLSAHSRGVNALMYTLGGSPIPGDATSYAAQIPTSKVVKVTIFDDNSPELGPIVTRAGLQAKTTVLLATEEANNTGLTAVDLRSPKIVASGNTMLAKECWRSIGYVRFIDDALRMDLPISVPKDKMDLANLFLGGVPPWKLRRQFTVAELQDLCTTHAAAGNMQRIFDLKKGLRDITYDLGLPRVPPYSPQVDRHHYHVAEVIHLAVP
jgi:hypothetical protein